MQSTAELKMDYISENFQRSELHMSKRSNPAISSEPDTNIQISDDRRFLQGQTFCNEELKFARFMNTRFSFM